MGLMSKTLVALGLAATTMTAAVFAGEDKITRDSIAWMLWVVCS